MELLFFLVQKTMLFSIPLLVVALGGMFSERSGIVNIALDGIMIFGAFCSVLFLNFAQHYMSGQVLLLLAILVAGVSGIVISLLHAYASINLNADQVISGTAINLLAPALAIYVARMIQGVQQITFNNTFRIPAVPVLSDIPIIGPMSEKDENVIKSAANIPGVRTALVTTMNVYEIINHTNFIITRDAVNKIEEVYS